MASSQMSPVILQTNFPGLSLRGRGKVRDIYEVGDELLIVATDRLSAFDVVFPTPIPDKGRVLTQLSMFWFEKLSALIPGPLFLRPNLKWRSRALCRFARGARHAGTPHRTTSHRRCAGARIHHRLRLEGLPADRHNLWNSAARTGLRESDRLPEPIFTPSTKATTGHDENISFEETAARIGRPLAEQLRDISLTIYKSATEHLPLRGDPYWPIRNLNLGCWAMN